MNSDVKKLRCASLRSALQRCGALRPIHARKNSRGIHFCANTCGACIRIRARNYLPNALPNSLGNSFRCEYMRRLHSHLRQYRKTSLRIICLLNSCQEVLEILRPMVGQKIVKYYTIVFLTQPLSGTSSRDWQ